MISRDLTLRINNNVATLNEPVTVYMYDRGILLNIKVLEYKYKTGAMEQDNIVQKEQIVNASALIKSPDGKVFKYPDVKAIISDDIVKILITKEWTDEENECGNYQIQIQLYDMENSRVSLPPFSITVSNTVAPYDDGDDGDTSGIVDISEFNSAYIGYDAPVHDESNIVDGFYDKTIWVKGMNMSTDHFNKIEKRLEEIYSGVGLSKTNISELDTESKTTSGAINEILSLYEELKKKINNLTPETVKPDIRNITITNNKKINMKIGDSFNINYTVSPTNADKYNVGFFSSNNGVCTVSTSGRVTATGIGSCIITCFSSKDESICDTIEVITLVELKEIESIDIVRPVILFDLQNERQQIEYVLQPEDTTQTTLNWVSSNENVCTVSDTGVITRVLNGTDLIGPEFDLIPLDSNIMAAANITCVSSVNSKIYDFCRVEFGQTIKSLSISGNVPENLSVGDTFQLSANAEIPNNLYPGYDELLWTTSNSNVAIVDDKGLVTITGEGSCNIICKAKYGSILESISINVKNKEGEGEEEIKIENSIKIEYIGASKAFNSSYPHVNDFEVSYDGLTWNQFDNLLDETYNVAYLRPTTVITTINNMFYEIQKMKEGILSVEAVDLSLFDASNVTRINWFAHYINTPKKIILPLNLNSSIITNTTSPFGDNSRIIHIDARGLDVELNDIISADLYDRNGKEAGIYIATEANMSEIAKNNLLIRNWKLNYAEIEKVDNPITGINLKASKYLVNVGDVIQLSCELIPSDTEHRNIEYVIIEGGEYVSLNKNTGSLTIKAEGTIKIQAKSLDNPAITSEPIILVVLGPYTIKYKTINAAESFHVNDHVAVVADSLEDKEGIRYYNPGAPITSVSFSGMKTLIEIVDMDTSNLTNTENMFLDCTSLTTIPYLDISNVTNSRWMFDSCISLTEIPYLDTSNITSTHGMFSHCESLTEIPYLDISNVTDAGRMFAYCHSLITIPNLNTSNVTDMRDMFWDCTSLTTIPYLNTSNVTNMRDMFWNCHSLTSLDLSEWDVSNVTNMSGMFEDCNSLPSIDLSGWNVRNVTDMGTMFKYCKSLTSVGDISNWNVEKVTSMHAMFYRCKSLTSLDLSNWDVSSVTDMKYMFEECSSLTSLDLSGWNLNSEVNLGSMCNNCSSLTSLDLSGWDMSKINSDLFYKCDSLVSINYLNSLNAENVIILAELLPYRNNLSSGTLTITRGFESDELSSILQDKNWNLVTR